MRVITISTILVLLWLPVWGQQSIDINVCETKTTHIIFKSPIRYFDFGTDDIGVVNTTEPNIIKVKAAISNFDETNLTVMTEDNTFFSMIIRYHPNPSNLNFFIEPDRGTVFETQEPVSSSEALEAESTGGMATGGDEVEMDIKSSNLIKATSKQAFVAGEKKDKVTLAVNRIFVDSERLYFVMDAVNETAVNYDVDFIKLFIKPRRSSKRSSTQEEEMTPVHTFNLPTTLKMNPTGLTNFVITVNKFTIAQGKKFVIEMWEQNGERSLELEVKSKDLLRAVPVPRE